MFLKHKYNANKQTNNPTTSTFTVTVKENSFLQVQLYKIKHRKHHSKVRLQNENAKKRKRIWRKAAFFMPGKYQAEEKEREK